MLPIDLKYRVDLLNSTITGLEAFWVYFRKAKQMSTNTASLLKSVYYGAYLFLHEKISTF